MFMSLFNVIFNLRHGLGFEDDELAYFIARSDNRASQPDSMLEAERAFHELFGHEEYKRQLKEVFSELVESIKNSEPGTVNEHINALYSLQSISATALWKHHLELDEYLDSFVREFDRLDVEEERERLTNACKIGRLIA